MSHIDRIADSIQDGWSIDICHVKGMFYVAASNGEEKLLQASVSLIIAFESLLHILENE
ncbi:MAG: hypothetical protein ACREOZ_02105 [Gloeomargaritales cyanobacterium]